MSGITAADRSETDLMLRNARLLYRQVSDLLDAAKLEAGGMRVDYARLDLAELVSAMASHFETVARERKIAFSIETPAALRVEADSEKLQRILLNLLSNAFKFTPDGGCVRVRLREAEQQAVIEVQDNGPGIPAEMRDMVFERFRQLQGASNRRHGGTGLGLAIVREFARLHGGSAQVGEAAGGGALLSISLPLKAPAGVAVAAVWSAEAGIISEADVDLASAVAGAAASASSGLEAALVLVVDDNADMRAFIGDCLRPRYRVTFATNGREGLALAQSLMPDLILADVMMPEMSGDAMVGELRRLPELAGIPIVVLTAKADDDLRIKLLQHGVQAYLTKPFKVEELLARIAGLIEERRRTGLQLRQSESRFEATFEQAAVGIALVAPDGRWLRVNRKLSDILGYSAAELQTRTFQDITFPDDLDNDLDLVRQMLVNQIDSYSLEKRYIRKDGSIVWGNLCVALVRSADGTPDYFISVVEDISRRKQAEAQLGLWRQAFEKSEFGVAIGDPATQTILSVNPAFARRRGYGADELVGKPVKGLFPGDCWQEVTARIQDADRQGHASFESEHISKSGERFPVLLDVTVTRSADSQPLNRIVYALDISERKQAERALRQQTDELKRRNDELERFDSAAIDRELMMIRLKRQVNDLATELGRAPPYEVAFADDARLPERRS